MVPNQPTSLSTDTAISDLAPVLDRSDQTTVSKDAATTSANPQFEATNTHQTSVGTSTDPAPAVSTLDDNQVQMTGDTWWRRNARPDVSHLARQWNAVCVVGLRVHSLDGEGSVKDVRA